MATHILKTLPKFFSAIKTGDKTFECRLNDRGYQVGDTLILKEWSQSDGFTKNFERVKVTYCLSSKDYGVRDGYVVMAIKPENE
jgi:hypothetical protein